MTRLPEPHLARALALGLALLAACWAVTACEAYDYAATPIVTAGEGLRVYVDSARRVVCYRTGSHSRSALSCVPLPSRNAEVPNAR